MLTRTLLLGSLSIFICLLLLTCSNEVQKEMPVTAEKVLELSEQAPVQTEHGDERTLLMYSGRGQSLIGPLVEQFTKDTGIQVRVKYASSSQLASSLLEEKENSRADLFYSQDPASLESVASLFSKVPSRLLEKIPIWGKSSKGNWVGVSARARVVVHNSRVNVADMPQNMWGFTDPKWTNRIGWAPTNGSFQAMVTSMRNFWGYQQTKSWLTLIMENDPMVYSKNTPIVAAVADEEVDIGFVNHYYLHRFQAEQGLGFNASNYYLTEEGPGSIVLLSGLGILKHTENKDLTEAFITYLLSDVGQKYFMTTTFEYPLVSGVSGRVESQECPICGIIPDLSSINYATPNYSQQLGDLGETQELLRSVGLIP